MIFPWAGFRLVDRRLRIASRVSRHVVPRAAAHASAILMGSSSGYRLCSSSSSSSNPSPDEVKQSESVSSEAPHGDRLNRNADNTDEKQASRQRRKLEKMRAKQERAAKAVERKLHEKQCSGGSDDHGGKTADMQKEKDRSSQASLSTVHAREPNALWASPDAPYPGFSAIVPAADLEAAYNSLDSGQRADSDGPVRVAGRVVAVRDFGKVVFIEIRSEGSKGQVAVQVGDSYSKAMLKKEVKDRIRVGDIVGATGYPGKTRAGQVSVFATSVEILAPYVCTDIACVPDQHGHNGLVDEEARYRYRFLDLMTNQRSVDVFRVRHKTIKAIRDYLDGHRFVEVETPVFHTVASGAAARPFVTHHNANDTDLTLRVSPELHLKECVVGGLERVYEIGRVFRNEGSDRSHNPEFTTVEFYMAYSNYEELMPMVEEMLKNVCLAATGESKVLTTNPRTGNRVEIDFSQPFKRVPMMAGLEQALGHPLPSPAELNTPTGVNYLSELLQQQKIPLPTPASPAKLLDKLCDHFITNEIEQPTFLIDHPVFMSPLAKAHPRNSGASDDEAGDGDLLSQRFELFINGMEVCNAYSELNDPREQYRRFEEQMRQRETFGDDEAQALDDSFLKALQVGLPPTAGFGMGIDRLVMILTDSPSIRDVILFPLLKADTGERQAKQARRTASFFGFNMKMTNFCLDALDAEMLRRGDKDGQERVKLLRQAMAEMCRQAEQVVPPPCSQVEKMMGLLFGPNHGGSGSQQHGRMPPPFPPFPLPVFRFGRNGHSHAEQHGGGGGFLQKLKSLFHPEGR